MSRRISVFILVSMAWLAPVTLAGQSDDELWVLGAGRGPGAAGSYWITDLHVLNVSDDEIDVEISLLLGTGGQAGEAKTFTLGPTETLTLPDVVSETFGRETALGAIHIEVVEDEDEELEIGENDPPVVAYARIFNRQTSGSVGQTVEGLPSHVAVSAEGSTPTTHVTGVTVNGAFRSNWFGISVDNTSEDDEEDGVAAKVLVEVLDDHGNPIASKRYTMPHGRPVFRSMAEIGSAFENATVRFTMEEGEGIFGVSKIDMLTNDPTTLEMHWRGEDPAEKTFTDEFRIDDCTFAATGENPYFPLTPGLRLVLEGEDDGETVRNTIEVTSQKVVVDGVTTRVVTETELVDGELAEKSRNFFAQCEETGSVFYFGEEVDIYEDGEIVSHEGAWRAGSNGARAGIIMPGEVLAGSRYYQEVAPDVALDRAEHLFTGITFETPAGTFEDCVSVRDTSPLDPTSSSLKVYCPGIGIVFDSGTELVSYTTP